MIAPTIGRRVWYWPTVHDAVQLDTSQPYDAGVIYVDAASGLVNLDVTSHNGVRFYVKGVKLGEEWGTPGTAQWMPYQLGQAAQAKKEEGDKPSS